MSKIESFEDLDCWKKACELRLLVSSTIKTFPQSEKYELISQMRRASRSVTHNIAEGYGRFHFKENAQFCRMERGSLYELLDQYDVALEEEYITKEKQQKLKNLTNRTIQILIGYINYLVAQSKSKR